MMPDRCSGGTGPIVAAARTDQAPVTAMDRTVPAASAPFKRTPVATLHG